MKQLIKIKVILLLIVAIILTLCSCNRAYTEKVYYGYQIVRVRDYQLEIVEDSILVFDGKRHVGTIPFEMEYSKSPLDILISEDNH